MTRTDAASTRPRGAVATGGAGVLSRVARAVPLALILSAGLLAPTSALAASELSGYGTTPTTTTTTTPPPTTTTTPTTPTTTPTSTTPTTPTSGTSPSKEGSSPTTTSSSGVAASTETTTTSAKTSKASTLPFTGFDLRWTLAVGLALIAVGSSLLVMQRRHRRGIGR
jgi:uncharacterized surface anchored protein